jgi:PilZ domain
MRIGFEGLARFERRQPGRAMDLTAELFMGFVDQSRKHVKKRLPEHRKSGRLALSAEVQILVSGGSSAKELVCTIAANISACGMALLVPKKLSLGQDFCVRLPSEESGVRWVRCAATRWQASSTGLTKVAARFCDLVQTETGEIPMLIDPAALVSEGSSQIWSLCKTLLAVDLELDRPAKGKGGKGGGQNSELRRVKRAETRFESTAVLLAEGKESVAMSIHIQDISTGGVGFACRKQFAKGARLAFILRFSDKKAKAVLAKVVRCIPIGATQFRIGAEFVESCAQNPKSNEIPEKWQEAVTVAAV